MVCEPIRAKDNIAPDKTSFMLDEDFVYDEASLKEAEELLVAKTKDVKQRLGGHVLYAALHPSSCMNEQEPTASVAPTVNPPPVVAEHRRPPMPALFNFELLVRIIVTVILVGRNLFEVHPALLLCIAFVKYLIDTGLLLYFFEVYVNPQPPLVIPPHMAAPQPQGPAPHTTETNPPTENQIHRPPETLWMWTTRSFFSWISAGFPVPTEPGLLFDIIAFFYAFVVSLFPTYD